MLRVSPPHGVASRSRSSVLRDEICSFSFLLTPFKFLTAIAAVSPFHSMRPSHSGKRGALRKSVANFVQARLLAARARVENKYLHLSMDVLPELAVQIACQSAPPLTRDLHRSHAPDRRLACPALGSASIWAETRRTRIENSVALQKHTVRPRLAHYMQTVES